MKFHIKKKMILSKYIYINNHLQDLICKSIKNFKFEKPFYDCENEIGRPILTPNFEFVQYPFIRSQIDDFFEFNLKYNFIGCTSKNDLHYIFRCNDIYIVSINIENSHVTNISFASKELIKEYYIEWSLNKINLISGGWQNMIM